MSADENLQRMKTLDDAWNAQNWEVFRKRHSTDTKVYWPGVMFGSGDWTCTIAKWKGKMIPRWRVTSNRCSSPCR